PGIDNTDRPDEEPSPASEVSQWAEPPLLVPARPRRLNSLLNGVCAELQPRGSTRRLLGLVAGCSPSPVRRRPTRCSMPIGCTVLGTNEQRKCGTTRRRGCE